MSSAVVNMQGAATGAAPAVVPVVPLVPTITSPEVVGTSMQAVVPVQTGTPATGVSAVEQVIAPVAEPAGKVASALSSDVLGNYLAAVAVFFLALLALWFVLWVAKKLLGTALLGRPAMQVEHRLSVGPKKWLLIANVQGKRLALGMTDHTITMLAELPEAVQAPANKSKKAVSNKQKSNIAPAKAHPQTKNILQKNDDKAIFAEFLENPK